MGTKTEKWQKIPPFYKITCSNVGFRMFNLWSHYQYLNIILLEKHSNWKDWIHKVEPNPHFSIPPLLDWISEHLLENSPQTVELTGTSVVFWSVPSVPDLNVINVDTQSLLEIYVQNRHRLGSLTSKVNGQREQWFEQSCPAIGS